MSDFHVIIPARYASTRLPGKALADIGGMPMICHVVECARQSRAKSVSVATDDVRIEQAVKNQPAPAAVVMTEKTHPSGTDRIAEAAEALKLNARDIVVNIQGDEPQMPPALINQVADLLGNKTDAAIATLAAPLDAAQLDDSAVVKVVGDCDGFALYFSRAAIARVRDDGDANNDIASGVVQRHLGIYAYRVEYLRRFAKRTACELEKRERLEQLRALWHGDKIACATAVEIPAPGIDTEADLMRVRNAHSREKI